MSSAVNAPPENSQKLRLLNVRAPENSQRFLLHICTAENLQGSLFQKEI